MESSGNNLLSPEWLTALGTVALAVMTFLAVLVAIFRDTIRAWFVHPELEISCSESDWEKTKLGSTIDCYYFRVRVSNNGKQRAGSVEILATKLEKMHRDKKFHKVNSFLPMNLTWTHSNKLAVFPGISRDMYRYCDLGKIIRPSDRSKLQNEDDPKFNPQKTIFSFELEVKPNSLPHLIEPGLYHLHLLVGCANAKPEKETLEIDCSGDWHNDESKMFADGIGIRVL